MPKEKMKRKADRGKNSSLADFDIHALEKEWHNHPKMVEDVVNQLTEAKRDYDEAKYELTVVGAKVESYIRAKPGKYGIEKGTEAEIKAAIILDERMQKANRRLLSAQDRKNTLDGYLTILDHRKRALEKEVDLWLAGYFNSPKQPKGDRVRKPRTQMKDDD